MNADWLSSHECRGKVQIFQLERKAAAFTLGNSQSVALQILMNALAGAGRYKSNLVAGFFWQKMCPICVSTLNLYGVMSPLRVWCGRTFTCATGLLLYSSKMSKNITSNLGESRCVSVCSYLGACVDDGAVMFENITCYLGECRCVVCECRCVVCACVLVVDLMIR